MTAEDLFFLVSRYGIGVLAIGTFLSCLALPVPSSLLMLAAGAFAASGDLSATAAFAAAWLGAVAGDQTGYFIGRRGGAALVAGIARRPARARLLTRARGLADRHGGMAVFLSRWLFSPLGPYVNFLAPSTGPAWQRFTLWAMAGEAVWVSLYLGLGIAFSGQVSAVARIAANAVGFLGALAAVAVIWFLLREALRTPRG